MLIFPTLPGQGWSVHKTPVWKSRVVESVSGREKRLALWRWPKYQFEVSFEALSSSTHYPGLQDRSLQNLVDFFHRCQGQANTFLYRDRTDDHCRGGVCGVGDGVTTAFAATRPVGAYSEPVGFIDNVDAVYLDGVATDAWTLQQPNVIALQNAPAAGVVVTADFWFSFVCRLEDDTVEMEQFMQDLWSVKNFKFRSVRT